MKIRQCFLELQVKMSGMFFETQYIDKPKSNIYVKRYIFRVCSFAR